MIFERLEYVAETGKFENTGEMHEFPARTVCVAAGTSPNVIYEKEKPGTFQLDEWRQFFQPFKVEQRTATAVFTLFEAAKSESRVFSRRTNTTASSSAITATIIRSMRETSSRRWPRQSTAIEKVVELFADELATRGPLPQAERDSIFDQP